MAQARARVAEGWRYLRYDTLHDRGVLEPPVAARQTAAMLAAVRDAVGDEVELLVDVEPLGDEPGALTEAMKIACVRPTRFR